MSHVTRAGAGPTLGILALMLFLTPTVQAQGNVAATAQNLADRLCVVAGDFEAQAKGIVGLAEMDATFEAWGNMTLEMTALKKAINTAALTDAQIVALKGSLAKMQECNKRIQKVLPEWVAKADAAENNLNSGYVPSAAERRTHERMKNEAEVRKMAERLDQAFWDILVGLPGGR